MARKALRTGCAIQRGPVCWNDLYIAAGNPEGARLAAKETLGYFWSFQKCLAAPETGIDTRPEWQDRASNKRQN